MRAVGRPVDIGVQSDAIPGGKLDIMIHANIAGQGLRIVTVPAFGQDFGFSWLEALIVVVADLRLADWLERNGDGLRHLIVWDAALEKVES